MFNLFNNEHPKGLYLLFLLEMWERFSFYGMRALLVLYMIQELMFTSQQAGNIYGLYTGLVYLTPLLGGYIADRYFGQRKCITAGAILMSVGLFVLAFGSKSLFLFSLFLMITANGLFKSNISSVLGLLYENKADKKDSAYTIFYMGINLGAFFSPLVCGTLAFKYGFQYGFAAAGIGMLIGFTLYKLNETELLGETGLKPVQQTILDKNEVSIHNEHSEGGSGRGKLLPLLVLFLFTIPFWICFEQAGSSLTLLAEFQTDRNFMGHIIPTGYFQSLNPFFIITLAPLISILWSKLRVINKEPTSVEKFAIALFLMSVSYLILIFAGIVSANSKLSPLWLVLVYFVMTIAELCLSPIGLSLVSKCAPKQFLSLLMGCWFLTCFIGDILAGFWGGKYGCLTFIQLYTPLVILPLVASIILIILIPKLNKIINE